MTNSIFFLLVFVCLDLFLYLLFCGHLLGAFDITSQGSFRTPARQAGARHRHVGGSTMMAGEHNSNFTMVYRCDISLVNGLSYFDIF